MKMIKSSSISCYNSTTRSNNINNSSISSVDLKGAHALLVRGYMSYSLIDALMKSNAGGVIETIHSNQVESFGEKKVGGIISPAGQNDVLL
jgi:hypothetical protein